MHRVKRIWQVQIDCSSMQTKAWSSEGSLMVIKEAFSSPLSIEPLEPKATRIKHDVKSGRTLKRVEFCLRMSPNDETCDGDI